MSKNNKTLGIVLGIFASIFVVGSISVIVSNANDDNKKPSVNSSNTLSEVVSSEIEENINKEDVFANYLNDRSGYYLTDYSDDGYYSYKSDGLGFFRYTNSIPLNDVSSFEIVFPYSYEELMGYAECVDDFYSLIYITLDDIGENQFDYPRFGLDYTDFLIEDYTDGIYKVDLSNYTLEGFEDMIINYIYDGGTIELPKLYLNYKTNTTSTMSLRKSNYVEDSSDYLSFFETSPEEDLTNEVIWEDLQ